MKGLTQGVIVHYVYDEANEEADIPCVILKVHDRERGIADLHPLAPFDRLRRDGGEYPAFDASKVSYSELPKNRTWHFLPQDA